MHIYLIEQFSRFTKLPNISVWLFGTVSGVRKSEDIHEWMKVIKNGFKKVVGVGVGVGACFILNSLHVSNHVLMYFVVLLESLENMEIQKLS